MKSNLFLGKLKANGRNVDWVANQMQEHGRYISKSTIYKKLRGDSEFTAGEIKMISEIMNFSEKEMYDIFLKN